MCIRHKTYNISFVFVKWWYTIFTAGDPYCSGNDTVEEHDIVEYKCEIEYSGYWPPVMEWYQDGTPVINYSITVSMVSSNVCAHSNCLSVYHIETNTLLLLSLDIPHEYDAFIMLMKPLSLRSVFEL